MLIAHAARHPRSQSVSCDAAQSYHVPPNRESIGGRSNARLRIRRSEASAARPGNFHRGLAAAANGLAGMAKGAKKMGSDRANPRQPCPAEAGNRSCRPSTASSTRLTKSKGAATTGPQRLYFRSRQRRARVQSISSSAPRRERRSSCAYGGLTPLRVGARFGSRAGYGVCAIP